MGLRKALLLGKSDTSRFKAACIRSDSLDLAKRRIAQNHVQEEEFHRIRQGAAEGECGNKQQAATHAQGAGSELQPPLQLLEDDCSPRDALGAKLPVDSIHLVKARLDTRHAADHAAPDARGTRAGAKRRGSWAGEGAKRGDSSANSPRVGHAAHFRRASDNSVLGSPDKPCKSAASPSSSAFARLLRKFTSFSERPDHHHAVRQRPSSASIPLASRAPLGVMVHRRVPGSLAAAAAGGPRPAPQPSAAAWTLPQGPLPEPPSQPEDQQQQLLLLSQAGPQDNHMAAAARFNRASAPSAMLAEPADRSEPEGHAKEPKHRNWLSRLSHGLTSARHGRGKGPDQVFSRRSADLGSSASSAAAGTAQGLAASAHSPMRGKWLMYDDAVLHSEAVPTVGHGAA